MVRNPELLRRRIHERTGHISRHPYPASIRRRLLHGDTVGWRIPVDRKDKVGKNCRMDYPSN